MGLKRLRKRYPSLFTHYPNIQLFISPHSIQKKEEKLKTKTKKQKKLLDLLIHVLVHINWLCSFLQCFSRLVVGVWCANKSSIYDDYRLMLSMISSAALEDSIYLYLSYSKLAETHLPSLSFMAFE